MALFPRRIAGRYAALSRWDRKGDAVAYSDDAHDWSEARTVQSSARPWALIQLGNCGSLIETPMGWLVFTHDVGPMREYAIGVVLLDLDEPERLIAALPEPLLVADEPEREGYVPDVVYPRGSRWSTTADLAGHHANVTIRRSPLVQIVDYGRCGQRSCDPGLHAHIGYYCVSGVHIGGHGAQLGGALAHSAPISCPHSYPLFCEALGLDQGHRFLEVGLGSGHGAALAREVAGPGGLVVSVEIDPATPALAEAGQRSLPGLMRLSCNSTRTWAAEGPIRSPALPAGVLRAGGEGVCTENAWPQR